MSFDGIGQATSPPGSPCSA